MGLSKENINTIRSQINDLNKNYNYIHQETQLIKRMIYENNNYQSFSTGTKIGKVHDDKINEIFTIINSLNDIHIPITSETNEYIKGQELDINN